MLRSATFVLGILLAALAFVGFLMLGGMMAPPPYSVVVAVQDIPAYSTLDANALGVDDQRINSQVARTLILREEIDQYIGGFILENIQAGEPLRKSVIVAPGNPQAANRLALVMTDPDKVAMVIPVDEKTAPSQIAPGDWLDLVIGLAPGNISAGSQTTFSNLLASAPPVSPFVSAGRPTPTPTPPISQPTTPGTGLPIGQTGTIGPGEMNLPASKVVIQNVPVLAVRFQKEPNPAFTGATAGFAGEQAAPSINQPAYIRGDIQSVTVLVPRASVELVAFGIDNGRVRLILLPARAGQAANGAQGPTFGVTFNDWLAWMMHERSLASGIAPPQPTPAPGALPPPPQPTAQPAHASGQPQPPPTPETSPGTIPTGLDFAALLLPLLCGVVLLFLFVAVVRFIRQRRRDSALV